MKPIPALKPLLTPLAFRDATIRDHTAAYARAGIAIDPRQIERQAVSDCEVYDRVTGAQPLVVKQTDAQLADVRAIRKKERDEEAARTGGAVSVTPDRVVSSIVPAAHMPATDDRQAFAWGRAQWIMQGATVSTNPEIMTSTCVHPKAALALWRIYADFAIRHMKRKIIDEANPYEGLSEEDCGRLLWRKIEDVCDTTTGQLGPWFVPK